jgi:hypothetical protein
MTKLGPKWAFFSSVTQTWKSNKSYKFTLDNTKISKFLRQSKIFIDQQTPFDWPKSDVFRGVNFAISALLLGKIKWPILALCAGPFGRIASSKPGNHEYQCFG